MTSRKNAAEEKDVIIRRGATAYYSKVCYSTKIQKAIRKLSTYNSGILNNSSILLRAVLQKALTESCLLLICVEYP